MTEEKLQSDDPIVECDSCNRRNQETDGPPFYRFPFWWGRGPRLALEWWCEDCIESVIDEGWVRWNDEDLPEVQFEEDGEFYPADVVKQMYLNNELFNMNSE